MKIGSGSAGPQPFSILHFQFLRREIMAQVKLTTPVDEATIRSLRVGDMVSINGRLYTG